LTGEGLGQYNQCGNNEQKREDLVLPTALQISPYRIYFYSYDFYSYDFYSYDCREPRHMHVDRDNSSAKFWLDPDIALVHNHGYRRKEVRDYRAHFA